MPAILLRRQAPDFGMGDREDHEDIWVQGLERNLEAFLPTGVQLPDVDP
jgi:hypothetical protein